MKSGTAAVARTTTTGAAESHARGKRNGGEMVELILPSDPTECEEAQYTYYGAGPPKDYIVWTCPNGTAYVDFTGGFCIALNIKQHFWRIS